MIVRNVGSDIEVGTEDSEKKKGQKQSISTNGEYDEDRFQLRRWRTKGRVKRVWIITVDIKGYKEC